MKLESVQVTNFRSVEDSDKFSIAPITCLVGKNEAGKSAILSAVAALNPHPATPVVFDKERDYPRRSLTQYDEKHGKEQAIAVQSTWRLDESECEEIQGIVGDALVGDTVVVTRRYGEKSPNVKVEIDLSKAFAFLFNEFELDEAERAPLLGAKDTANLAERLKGIVEPTEKQKSLLQHLGTLGNNVTSYVQQQVAKRLPKFMYFSSYDRMDGAIQIEQIRDLIANGSIRQDNYRGARLFQEFLDYAGVPFDEISKVTTYETFNAKLQAASNNITDQVLEYWTQNPDLRVQVRIERALPGDAAPYNTGTIARARIENTLHRVDTPFSERSAGFVWFFSFLVKFAQVKDDDSPVVLLLDEPGLTLHGKAQADLLRFFRDKLGPHHQVIYSTHSPFMVPADDLAAVRIVEDQVEMKGARRVPIGTKVREDVLTRDPDTLFPLQGALGYEITQSLFIGKNTLLVEGPGEILYLQALSDALRRRGRVGLDARWTVCPAGGIDKIAPFVSLFAGNALHVAALSDQAAGDKRKVEDLKRSEVLKSGHFYTMADFLNRGEADIEDMFEPELFAEILNDCYALKAAHTLTKEKLKAALPATDRLVKQAEAAFKVMPQTIQMFDHFAPASWLLRNPATLDQAPAPVVATLDRAERVFRTFNELL